jgi:hypothetical protein
MRKSRDNTDLAQRALAHWDAAHPPEPFEPQFPWAAGLLFERDRFVIERFWQSEDGRRVARGRLPLRGALAVFLTRHSLPSPPIDIVGHFETLMAALEEVAPPRYRAKPGVRRRYRRRERDISP